MPEEHYYEIHHVVLQPMLCTTISVPDHHGNGIAA